MLDITLSCVTPDAEWSTLQRVATLPVGFTDPRPSPSGDGANTRRKHQRVVLHGRAILSHGNPLVGEGLVSGVHLCEFSASGMSLYSPVQLLPKERVVLNASNCTEIVLVVTRCRRVRNACYQCGATFAAGPLSPGRFRSMIDEFRV